MATEKENICCSASVRPEEEESSEHWWTTKIIELEHGLTHSDPGGLLALGVAAIHCKQAVKLLQQQTFVKNSEEDKLLQETESVIQQVTDEPNIFKGSVAVQLRADVDRTVKLLENIIDAVSGSGDGSNGQKELVADLQFAVGNVYRLTKNFPKSITFLEASLKAYENLHKAGLKTTSIKRKVLLSNYFIAWAYYESETYHLARRHSEKAVKVLEKLGSECDDLHLGLVYEILANATMRMRDADATEMFEKGVEIYSRLAAENRKCLPSYASMLRQLAVCYTYLAQYAKSLETFQKSLEMLKELRCDSERLIVLYMMATCYKELNDFDNCARCYAEVIEIYETLIAAEGPQMWAVIGRNVGAELASTSEKLARLYLDAGRLTEAEKYFLKAIDAYEKYATLDDGKLTAKSVHPQTQAYHGLANVYMNKKGEKDTEARKYLIRTTELLRKLAEQELYLNEYTVMSIDSIFCDYLDLALSRGDKTCKQECAQIVDEYLKSVENRTKSTQRYQLYYTLGHVYVAIGAIDKVQDCYRKAIAAAQFSQQSRNPITVPQINEALEKLNL